jgi:hypothetical protein
MLVAAKTLEQVPSLTVGYTPSLQLNAKQPETFTPSHLSLPHQSYEEMVRAMHLPFRAIEGTSVVGPFFWCSFDQDDDDPHLRMSPTHHSLIWPRN